jgi:uncharacterized protein YukE
VRSAGDYNEVHTFAKTMENCAVELQNMVKSGHTVMDQMSDSLTGYTSIGWRTAFVNIATPAQTVVGILHNASQAITRYATAMEEANSDFGSGITLVDGLPIEDIGDRVELRDVSAFPPHVIDHMKEDVASANKYFATAQTTMTIAYQSLFKDLDSQLSQIGDSRAQLERQQSIMSIALNVVPVLGLPLKYIGAIVNYQSDIDEEGLTPKEAALAALTGVLPPPAIALIDHYMEHESWTESGKSAVSADVTQELESILEGAISD